MLKTKSFLLVMLVSLVSLIAVGCGNSREDFVVTNQNQVGASNGNLVFRFNRVAAQIADNVPAGTATLRFDLFSDNPPTTAGLVSTEQRAFAEEIILSNVPPNVVQVLVTSLDAQGFPLATSGGSVSVIVGVNNEVNLDDATPVTLDAITVTPNPVAVTDDTTAQLVINGAFSNGSTATLPISTTVASFSSSNTDVANISTTGLVSTSSEGCGANTTGTAQYTLNGTTVNSSEFVINAFCFEVFPSQRLIMAQSIETELSFTIGVGQSHDNGYFVSIVNGSGEKGDVSGTSLTYALVEAVDGVTVSSDGVITAASTVVDGTTFIVRATYVVDGVTITDDMNWTVTDRNSN